MLVIASRPNTSCVGVALVVVWYVALVANIVAAKMPEKGSLGSIYFSSNLKVQITLPMVWCMRSSIELACGFQTDAGLFLIP